MSDMPNCELLVPRLPADLDKSDRLSLKLDLIGLLLLLHDPFPPSGVVYTKISLLHKFDTSLFADKRGDVPGTSLFPG